MRFPLTRSSEELGRFRLDEAKFLYVYRRYVDRWDVLKIPRAKAAEAMNLRWSLERLFDEVGVTYRILEGGECTCPGFKYHGGCRHADNVKAWARGELGGAK
jgi:hypothetical protein